MSFKKSLASLFIALATTFFVGCSDTQTEQKVQKEPKIVMKTLDVKGMTCEGCEATIVDYVTKMDGVISSKASHVKESVIVKYDESKTDIDAVAKTISNIGYKVNGLKEEPNN